MQIPVSLLVILFNLLNKADFKNVQSFGAADNFKDWQMSELEISGVSEEIFTEFDKFDCSAGNSSSAVKALATRLLAEDDYKMKCVEYFMSLSDDCKNIELEFPYFNLLFLVGYVLLLGIQVICMLRHRFSTLCHYMANIHWRKFREEFKFVKTHNKGKKVYHSKHEKLIMTHKLRVIINYETKLSL